MKSKFVQTNWVQNVATKNYPDDYRSCNGSDPCSYRVQRNPSIAMESVKWINCCGTFHRYFREFSTIDDCQELSKDLQKKINGLSHLLISKRKSHEIIWKKRGNKYILSWLPFSNWLWWTWTILKVAKVQKLITF
jgi:hypothetical protein